MAEDTKQRQVKIPNFTRREIRGHLKQKFDDAVRRESHQDFMDLVTSVLGIQPGSDDCRFLEAKFWTAVAERRKSKLQEL
jgi:hypothetical protein